MDSIEGSHQRDRSLTQQEHDNQLNSYCTRPRCFIWTQLAMKQRIATKVSAACLSFCWT